MTPKAHKRVAAEEARPLNEQSAAKGRQAAQWNERLKEIRKATPRDAAALADAESKVKELTREARDLAAKAKEIEDGVYDLKAVNPNRKPDSDTRTPEELLALIAAKGREIAESLAPLRVSNTITRALLLSCVAAICYSIARAASSSGVRPARAVVVALDEACIFRAGAEGGRVTVVWPTPPILSCSDPVDARQVPLKISRP